MGKITTLEPKVNDVETREDDYFDDPDILQDKEHLAKMDRGTERLMKDLFELYDYIPKDSYCIGKIKKEIQKTDYKGYEMHSRDLLCVLVSEYREAKDKKNSEYAYGISCVAARFGMTYAMEKIAGGRI